MRNILLLICTFPLLLTAQSLSESYHLYRAQSLAQHHHYVQALSHYRAIEHPTDVIRYNLGNLLYHLKRYDEAIAIYMQINNPTLLHQKYHNIANTLMQMQHFQRAISFYQNALKFKQHPDTYTNLSIAKRRYQKKQKAEEEERKRERKKAATEMQLRNGSETINRFKEDNGTENLKDAPEPTQIIKQHNSATTALSRKVEKISTETAAEHNLTQIADQTRQYRHTLELKWQQHYQNRVLKTLLIPLTTPRKTNQGAYHDQKPY